jgi:hypothetical protein
MKQFQAKLYNVDQLSDIFIHEDSMNTFALVSIPELAWSHLIEYGEDSVVLKRKVVESLSVPMFRDKAEELAEKIYHWLYNDM